VKSPKNASIFSAANLRRLQRAKLFGARILFMWGSKMMYIAKEGERLDEIAYRYYATLENFAQVLEHNRALLPKEKLSAGDRVVLPDWRPPKTKEAAALW
jgi:phage tail protein X